MAKIGLRRTQVKLRKLTGIRARVVLLALILVAPLMLERVRSLEAARTLRLQEAAQEIEAIARQSAEAQRQVFSSVEAVLRTAANVQNAAARFDQSCAIIRSSLHVNLPWIRALSVIGRDGRISCATIPSVIGLDLSDRPYYKEALRGRAFLVSDYLFSRATNLSTIIAALPLVAVDSDAQAEIVIAAIDLDWMSRVLRNREQAGVNAAVVDREGVVLASTSDAAGIVGQPFVGFDKIRAAMSARPDAGTIAGRDGGGVVMSYARVPETTARLIVSVDETQVAAGIDQEMRSAYWLFALVCAFVLAGALLAAERLIVRPIKAMTRAAKTFGSGDWSRRVRLSRLPVEYRGLARALNAMAARLGQRERQLVATNDRLAVMASMDALSGLLNRRGFQSRLEFEWLKATNESAELSLLMIDVDYFKLFNDTYGHPEGDTCLASVGDLLATLAIASSGTAARYGGEEFTLTLPATTMAQAAEIGETVRRAIADLGRPHEASPYGHVTVSIGVACAAPNETCTPSDLIEAADTALYAAKRGGRNRIARHGFAHEGYSEALRKAG